MNNISLGKYVPLNTVIHRIDPRLKLIWFISMFVVLFLSYGTTRQNFLIYGVVFIFFFAAMLIGKVSFLQVFRSLKAIWLMMIFLLVINVLVTSEGTLAFYIGSFAVYYEGIIKTLYIIARLLLIIMMTSILTSTTKPIELTFAIEWLLTPLSWLKVPVQMFAMTLSLAIRFIPTLAEEAQRMMHAQAARGIDFKEGKFKEKVRGLVSLIIPLFMQCIMRAQELADAMDARGYNPLGKRTKYRRRHFTVLSLLFILVLAGVLATFIVLAIYQYDFIGMIINHFNL